jgi:3-hydroxyacyl-CoA dehydrogenase
MHFFNPPRYLKLLELIPTPDTDPAILAQMVAFGRDVLGKGVVVCKDTPNFIGNRFMSITASHISEYALENGYTIAEVDALTGQLIGRPNTGTFRLLDLVGIDVMAHVAGNLYDLIPDDSYREKLRAPKSAALTQHLLDNKWLGNKTGQGYYKQDRSGGQRVFLSIDPATRQYVDGGKPRWDSVGAVRKIEDTGERLRKLLTFDDRAATFVRELIFFNLAYAAYVTPEIAYAIPDVDNANKWGFAHEMGPFEIWDALGVPETIEKMEAAGHAVADWVKEMVAAGHTRFYQNGTVYDFATAGYKPLARDNRAIFVKDLYAANKVVAQNGSASLLDMGDGVLLYEFHSKMNAIDDDMGQIGRIGLEKLQSDFDAMVMGNNGQDFCIGANIAMIGIAAAQGMWQQIEEMVKGLQMLTMALRHAPKPVITAPHQRVLGGGVEMTMAGWESVADHETYMGLVEVGVGLIPAGGGLKEILIRKVNPVMRTANADVLPVMQDLFTAIATAKVGLSAWENRELGYLRDSDTLVFNSDQRLALAKQRALQLVAAGALPPETEKVYAAGRDVYYALRMGLQSFAWGGYATAHDVTVGSKLAYALCGGDLSAPTWVDPWHILDLEREGFLSLCGEEKTQARIMQMLQTGKPLRN